MTSRCSRVVGRSAGRTGRPVLDHRAMGDAQPKDKLHGITLDYGWPELGQLVSIPCFQSDPSVPPWARFKVESLYLFMLRAQARGLRAD